MTNSTDHELAKTRQYFNAAAEERDHYPKRRNPPNPEGKPSVRYYCPNDGYTTTWVTEGFYETGPPITQIPGENGLYRARLICCTCAMISNGFLLDSPDLAKATVRHEANAEKKPYYTHRDKP